MAYDVHMAYPKNMTPAKLASAAIANESDLGPAMRALNPRQRAFVDAMFVLGTDATYADAARAAGYESDTANALRVQAHRLAHSDKVQAAMREEAERRCAGLLPIAHAGMATILTSPQHPDHFKAIKHAQALAGVAPTQKHEVVHKHDAASLKADLLAAMDLLKSVAGPMIDVTPEEVSFEADPTKTVEARAGVDETENHSQEEEDWIAT